MSDIVQKLWGFCHTLRHDGVDYGDYIEQLTYLLFLKMADERGVQLEREISLWKDCVEAQDVRARPRVRRLALGGLAVEGDRELDRGTVGHGLTVAQLDDSRP